MSLVRFLIDIVFFLLLYISTYELQYVTLYATKSFETILCVRFISKRESEFVKNQNTQTSKSKSNVAATLYRKPENL